MANQLNDFDQLIKKTYENHEFPYDHTVWENIEQDLASTTPSMLDFFKSMMTGVSLVGAIFVTMLVVSADSGMESAIDDDRVATHENNVVDPDQMGNTKEVFVENEKSGVRSDQNNANSDSSDYTEAITNEENPVPENAPTESSFTAEQKSTVTAVIAEAKKLGAQAKTFDENPTTSEEESGASVKRGCTGLTIDFDAPSDYGDNAKYLWNFGDGFFSNDENPTHVFNKEGIFDVSLSVTAVGSGQISSNVVQAMIEVHEAPTSNFNVAVNSMNDLQLTNKSTNAVGFEWYINDKKKSTTASEIKLSIADNTKFDIALVADNAGSCSDTLQKEIHIIKAGNQFPQMYSTAYASDFAPGAIVDNGQVTDFRVFEKNSGSEVFRASGSKGWNGKNKEGEEVAKGEYQWLMVVDSEEVINIYQGSLSIR